MYTQKAITLVKRTFEMQLSTALSLTKIGSPAFVLSQTGVQDDLSGIEKPVCFHAKAIQTKQPIEIIHSLAKWKRMMLAQYQVPVGEGIVTDMRAIRPDEEDLTTGIHSIYVDQWDWEQVIDASDRHIQFLIETVRKIYAAIKKTEAILEHELGLQPMLPESIHFVHAETLLKRWPHLSPRQRENRICQELGAVFIVGIGDHLSDGQKHDARAPDYDDWSSAGMDGLRGLNGDILVWSPMMQRAFEISSMGIRVDNEALLRQLTICGCPEKQELSWHQMLLQDRLPLSIGGGIGQSRLTMLLLQKRHIGEVQHSIWPDSVKKQCAQEGVLLL